MNDSQQTRSFRDSPAEVEADRAIPRALTELASALGDLETAARAVAGRIQYAIPGGSPFDRLEKEMASKVGNSPSAPQPVRSHICDELHTRIYQLRQVTARLNEMAQGVEL